MVLVHPVITSEKYQFGAKAAANFTFPLTHIHAATSGYLSGIKQWGLYTENKYFTFPISFKQMCIMVAVHATPDTGINKISVIDPTLSRGRVNSDGNGSSHVIMIGV